LVNSPTAQSLERYVQHLYNLKFNCKMSIPNIDFFGKLLTFLGLAVIILSAYYLFGEYTKLRDSNLRYYKASFLSSEQVKKLGELHTDHKNQLRLLLEKNDTIINDLKKDPNNYPLIKNQLKSTENEMRLINLEFDRNFEKEKGLFDSLINISATEENFNSLQNSVYSQENKKTLFWIAVGFVIFVLGIGMWIKKEEQESEILIRQNLDKPTYSRICQSCGRKFDSLIIHGTESNGTPNYHFCKTCYTNGSFIEPGLTLEQLTVKTQNEMLTAKIKRSTINRVIKVLATLDRWKANHYL